MTGAAAFEIFRRFWWAVPILGLAIALMLTRGTLSREKKAHGLTKAAYAQFVDDVKAKTELARIQHAAKAARVDRDQERISKEVSGEYQEQLAALRARADALRVQLAAKADTRRSGGSAVPRVSTPAAGSDEAASDP